MVKKSAKIKFAIYFALYSMVDGWLLWWWWPTITLGREERAIMSMVLSTYVIEISYDIFSISSRHSLYGPVKNADFFYPEERIFVFVLARWQNFIRVHITLSMYEEEKVDTLFWIPKCMFNVLSWRRHARLSRHWSKVLQSQKVAHQILWWLHPIHP